MLRAYVDTQDDWERHLLLVLYAYRTAVHASTGVSPFMLMFGRQPQFTDMLPHTGFDPGSYQAHLQEKFAPLRDFVDSKATQAAQQQTTSYDLRSTTRVFNVKYPLWLSLQNVGKLDPRWEGKWHVSRVINPINLEITNGVKTKVVHVNHLQH